MPQPHADVDPNAPEVGMEGWQDLEDAYAFTYLDTTGEHLTVLKSDYF